MAKLTVEARTVIKTTVLKADERTVIESTRNQIKEGVNSVTKVAEIKIVELRV